MVVADVMMSNRWATETTSEWLARLLCAEGVDLMTASADQFERGTPVYVQADADVAATQRLMASYFIRVLPVVRDGLFVGIVELDELRPRQADIA